MKIVQHIENERGMVLLTSLMLMVILFLLGTTAYLITSNDLKIGGNYKTSKQAFYVAEAGIEHAIGILKKKKEYTPILDGTDTATSGPGILTKIGSDPKSFAGGTYYVRVFDNDDGDSDLTEDADQKVYITSTGTKDGATATIQVLFMANYLPINIDGALAIYGQGPGVSITGSPEIDGWDHAVPGDIESDEDFACSGSNCAGTYLPGEPGTAGIYSAVDLNPAEYIEEESGQNVFGDPPVKMDGTDKLTDWVAFANTAIPDNTVTVVNGVIAGNNTYGTRTDPQITVIESAAKIKGGGTVDGCGILIVRGCLEIVGTLHWEGIVLVTSEGDLTVDVNGTAWLLGAVVVAGEGASSEVTLKGNPSIKYSSQALDLATQAMGNAHIVSWENQYE